MIVSIEMIPVKPVFRRAAVLSGRSRARRAIFRSRDDAGESVDFVQKELSAQATEDRERWNFDFHTELPISGGRYLWQTVNRQASTITTDSQTSGNGLVELPELSATTEHHSTECEKTKQTKLSDYWNARKRLAPTPHAAAHKRSSTVPGDAESPAKVQRSSSS